MLDRESACNRVFLAHRFASVRACSFVFKLAAALRSTMSSPLPYCRTNQSSSDVGVIGMITASARHRWTCRRRNGTKRKFFNDFSRARACACAQGGVRSERFHDREAEAVRLKVPTHKFHLGQPVEFNPPRGIYALLLLMLRARKTVTPFHHQPEAQHPKIF